MQNMWLYNIIENTEFIYSYLSHSKNLLQRVWHWSCVALVVCGNGRLQTDFIALTDGPHSPLG